MLKNIAFWMIIGLALVITFNMVGPKNSVRTEISYSDLIEEVKNGNVKTVNIQGMVAGITEKRITGEFDNSTLFSTYAPGATDILSVMREHNVQVFSQPPEKSWFDYISWMLPFVFIVIIWVLIMRQMQGGAGGKAFSFGKSRARMLVPEQHKVTFADVAGVEEAKEELQEIVEFLKDPHKFQRLGGKIPKGVLLVGSPGTGKTLLARAVAGEAGVAFFSISGSDFVEMFVGVGAARIRDLFEQGKKNAPCIVFMDEIDAVGRHRGAGLGGGHDEREQTLNALLVEMDGFESSEGVILIAATNRPDVLDPALMRAGRFDRRVVVPLPDLKGRLEILKVHSKNIPMADDVDLEVIAKSTPGFAGAELANLVNEAALTAARNNKDKVDYASFEEAKDKVTLGKERRSMTISEKEKKITAYHESGHAIVSRMIPGTDPVHKVTIIPRGMALGLTAILPQDDRYTYSRDYLLGKISMMMGGRAAESVVYNHYTTGAGNDIERATDIARKMVTSWGMSEAMGPLSYGKKDEAIFLGKEIVSHKDYSEQTAQMIDTEVKKIVDYCYQRAMDILLANRGLLDKMSDLLLEKETINSDEINELIGEYADEKWRKVAFENSPQHETKVDIAD